MKKRRISVIIFLLLAANARADEGVFQSKVAPVPPNLDVMAVLKR